MPGALWVMPDLIASVLIFLANSVMPSIPTCARRESSILLSCEISAHPHHTTSARGIKRLSCRTVGDKPPLIAITSVSSFPRVTQPLGKIPREKRAVVSPVSSPPMCFSSSSARRSAHG